MFSMVSGKCAVVKTSTRQTYFLPVIGLVDEDKLKPGDLVGVNKDSYLILETLPAEYDARVKAMEVRLLIGIQMLQFYLLVFYSYLGGDYDFYSHYRFVLTALKKRFLTINYVQNMHIVFTEM